MPLSGVKYRTKGRGKKRIRYAIRRGKVVEVKHFSSGKVKKVGSRDSKARSYHKHA